MEAISTINNAISIIKRLREIAKNIEQAEFKNLLADLSNELADAKMELAEMKEDVLNLREEKDKLKARLLETAEKPTGTKWGCYIFGEDDGLYCTACWDRDRMKSRTSRKSAMSRTCPVCGAEIGAG